jgi:hypothetical protein
MIAIAVCTAVAVNAMPSEREKLVRHINGLKRQFGVDGYDIQADDSPGGRGIA